MAENDECDECKEYSPTEEGLRFIEEYEGTPEGHALREWIEVPHPKPLVAEFMRERGFSQFADDFEREQRMDLERDGQDQEDSSQDVS